MRQALLALLFIASLPNTALGETIATRMKVVSPKDFVRVFLGICAQNPGKYNRVMEIAKSFRFRKIPEQMAAGLAPQDSKVEWTGVIVIEGKGSPYAIGVSKARMNRRIMATCTISNPFIDSKKVATALKSFAGLTKPTQDQRVAGQRYRIWLTDNWAKDSFVSLTDAEPMGLSGVTIAFVSPLEE